MKSPPINARARRLTGRRELTDLQRRYSVAPIVQARWQREAARLFREYWRTGNPRHLAAFVRHVVAMRLYEKAATP